MAGIAGFIRAVYSFLSEIGAMSIKVTFLLKISQEELYPYIVAKNSCKASNGPAGVYYIDGKYYKEI